MGQLLPQGPEHAPQHHLLAPDIAAMFDSDNDECCAKLYVKGHSTGTFYPCPESQTSGIIEKLKFEPETLGIATLWALWGLFVERPN